jgi:hypothetical protein
MAQPASKQRSINNGHGGYVSWSEAGIYGFVVIDQSGQSRNRVTWLDYYIYQCPSDCFVLEAGYGAIPNGHLKGSGTSQLEINTDTSAIPGFNVYAGSGGPINIRWKKNVAVYGHSNNHWVNVYPTVKYRSHAVTDWNSAEVQGRVSGYSISNSYAEIRRIHSLDLTITKLPQA